MCFTCGSPTRSRSFSSMSFARRASLARMSSGKASTSASTVSFRVSTVHPTSSIYQKRYPSAPGIQMDAESATSFMGTARQILWALYGDYGLKPEQIDMGCDGVCAAEFGHVRLRWQSSPDIQLENRIAVEKSRALSEYIETT